MPGADSPVEIIHYFEGLLEVFLADMLQHARVDQALFKNALPRSADSTISNIILDPNWFPTSSSGSMDTRKTRTSRGICEQNLPKTKLFHLHLNIL